MYRSTPPVRAGLLAGEETRSVPPAAPREDAGARSPRRAWAAAGDGDLGQDPVAAAREICLSQLAARPRSRAELAMTLRRRHVTDEVAEQVLDRLTEVGLVDDEAFAAAFVSSARAGRGLSRRALANELRRRGVEEDASEAALAGVDADQEEETARALVVRRLRSMGSLSTQVQIRRLVAMLTRKGYGFDLAMRVVTQEVPGGGGGTDDLEET